MDKKINFLKQISDFFWEKTKNNGSLICPKHYVEHTGKNVYSVVIDLKLFNLTKEKIYFERAKKRVLRTAKNLVQDPEHGAWIFWPGRLNKYNISSSVIDSGACSDVLSDFYLNFQEKLNSQEKEKIKKAVFKNCNTYLKKAVVTKEITNQRLWGGTGLARAYRIFKIKEWKKALINSIERSLAEMWQDGTFPYHSHWREYKIFKGIYDTTPYYQSRCIVFIYYILENIDEDLDKYKEKLIKATDLLIGMTHPNGIKNINLECKRWYWLSPYEVASNSFDIYALTKTYKLTKNKIYAFYAKKSFEQILKHRLPDGGITSHLKQSQNNFQCRIFWNAHLAWLARIIEKIPISQVKERRDEFWHFENGDIIKFKNENYSCILRGRKQPMNLGWGPSMGGGSILYFGKQKNNWRNELSLDGWKENTAGNFSLYSKDNFLQNLKKFLAGNRKEIRTKLFQAKIELMAGRLRTFLSLIRRILKMVLSAGRKVYTSQWAINTVTKRKNNVIVFEIIPAQRDGKILEGTKLKREYIFGNDLVKVRENLFSKNPKINKIRYKKIPKVQNFKVISSLNYKENPIEICWQIYKIPFSVEISYELKDD